MAAGSPVMATGVIDTSEGGVGMATATEGAENDPADAQLDAISDGGRPDGVAHTESANRKKRAPAASRNLSRKKPTSNPAEKASERDLEEKNQ